MPNVYNGISTGFIYVDIDKFHSAEDTIAYKEKLKSNPYIYAMWISTSSLGLSILVKVTGLSKKNYSTCWNSLNEIFENRLDRNARGYNKVTCISYDNEVYINSSCTSFFQEEKQEKGGCSTYLYKKRSDKELLHPPSEGVRYRTELPDECFENVITPAVFPEGIKVLNVDLRYFYKYKIEVGRRQNVVGAVSMQLMELSPNATRKELFNAVCSFNQFCCVEPLTQDEVIRIFNNNYKKYKAGVLDTTRYERSKKVLWPTLCPLGKSDKQSIGQKALLKARGQGKEYSEEVIYNAIENLQDGNAITRKRIMEYTGLNEYQVKRYWKPFKSLVDEYNEGLNVKKTSNETITEPPVFTAPDTTEKPRPKTMEEAERDLDLWYSELTSKKQSKQQDIST